MKTQLTEIERKNLAANLLQHLNGDYRELYQPKRALLFCKGKPWHFGAKAAQNLKEIKISELLQMSDFELQDLKAKIDKAIAAKNVQNRQALYFSK